jgi:hypothetical protein
MTREEMVKQVEADRRAREDAILLLLMALTGRARRNVNRAVRVGTDWRPLLSGTLLGNPQLDLPGGVPLTARLMADSHAAGVRRVGLLTGVETQAAAPRDELVRRYVPRASEALGRIGGALERAVGDALAEAVPLDRISADVLAVGEAFRTAGYAEGSTHGAETEATAAVTSSYATGMGEGYGTPEVAAVTEALVFWNPLDEKTTRACRVRHGVTLPLDDPWWFTSYPPLHFGCRSLALPVMRKVAFTANPPTEPPADLGWGRWAGFVSAFQQV